VSNGEKQPQNLIYQSVGSLNCKIDGKRVTFKQGDSLAASAVKKLKKPFRKRFVKPEDFKVQVEKG